MRSKLATIFITLNQLFFIGAYQRNKTRKPSQFSNIVKANATDFEIKQR
jgi:hypothetical protein